MIRTRSSRRGLTPSRRAISLVEILVAIGVVALLAGLLVPALGAIRRTSRSTECLANLRQLAIADQLYVTHYDHHPVALRYEQPEGVLQQVAWDYVTTMTGDLVRPGPLWSFTDDPDRVQQCPEYHGGTNFADPHTGYNYNTTYVGGEAPFGQTGWAAVRRGVRPHACRRCTDVALFGDGGYAGGTNKFMRAPLNSVENSLWLVYAGGQAFRHHDATNVAHLDAHVSTITDPRPGEFADDAMLENVLDFPRNGFLSDDDHAYDPR